MPSAESRLAPPRNVEYTSTGSIISGLAESVDGVYTEKQVIGVEGRIRLVAFPDVEVVVADLF